MTSTLPATPIAMNKSLGEHGSAKTKAPPPAHKARSGPIVDVLFAAVAKAAAVFTLLILVAILVSLTISAWPAISKFGLGFLVSTTWDPVKEEIV